MFQSYNVHVRGLKHHQKVEELHLKSHDEAAEKAEAEEEEEEEKPEWSRCYHCTESFPSEEVRIVYEHYFKVRNIFLLSSCAESSVICL